MALARTGGVGADVAMTDGDGPWSRPAAPPPPTPPPRFDRRLRLALWVPLLALTAGAILVVSALFPGQLSDADKDPCLAGFRFMDRGRLGAAGRHALIWAGVLAVAVPAYTHRQDLLAVGTRVRSERAPAWAVSEAPRAIAVNPSDDGHFYVMGE